jgi:hypothetical protein
MNEDDEKFDFKQDQFVIDADNKEYGHISENDRLLAAKQILLGLALLFLVAQIEYIFDPDKGNVLLEIDKMVFPSLATFILAFYFRDGKG